MGLPTGKRAGQKRRRTRPWGGKEELVNGTERWMNDGTMINSLRQKEKEWGNKSATMGRKREEEVGLVGRDSIMM